MNMKMIYSSSQNYTQKHMIYMLLSVVLGATINHFHGHVQQLLYLLYLHIYIQGNGCLENKVSGYGVVYGFLMNSAYETD